MGSASVTPERLLPAEAPLDMPVQSLASIAAFKDLLPAPLHTPAPDIGRRRLFMVLGSLLFGLFAGALMFSALANDDIDALDIMFLALFFSLFTWISFGFLGALAGFVALARLGRPTAPSLLPHLPHLRTAVLLTIYNEDVDAVSRRLTAITASVAGLGASHLFDFFVLSDSSADAEAKEAQEFWRAHNRSEANVYYRRRIKNEARKPGNIAEWVKRFGGAYETMIVLDADSLMSGEGLTRLAVAMEEKPEVGLLQTIPTIIHGQTVFARWHQFAGVAYGHIASAGLQWWSGSESTYWGHNAIVRVRAFAECCGLPALSGSEPFGGGIMSHDMVEATLLRRRGWAVQMITLPNGSFEEFPPTLSDHAIRDRRWCQGNIQHLRLLGVAGLHWVSRLQLLMGASSYLTSPLWLLLLLTGLAEQARSTDMGIGELMQPWLLALTALLLFGPKIISLIWLAIDRNLRKSLGGGARVIATVAIEIPLSMLVAPIIMLGQSIALIEILRGRPSGWHPQRRVADGLAWSDAIRLYRWHVALGMVFLLAALALSAGESVGAIWTIPVTASLLLAPVTAMLLSRRDLGAWLSRHGLFISASEPEMDSRQTLFVLQQPSDANASAVAQGRAELNLAAQVRGTRPKS